MWLPGFSHSGLRVGRGTALGLLHRWPDPVEEVHLKVCLAEGSQGWSTARKVVKQAREVQEVVLGVEVHQRPVAHEGVAGRAEQRAEQAQRRHGLQAGPRP